MHCRPLDPGDRYHQRLANIVEETRLATGAPRLECFTVATLGLNAFSFSDLRGGAIVGVTEGALSRLSRQQLQAVVAHEFGHILSGSYVTVTASCLLFGIYGGLEEQLEGAGDLEGSSGATSVQGGALAVAGWLRLVRAASSLCDAALSRDRERQADLAAARFTRDPLSLAEALRLIAAHPGGAGSIPEGLAPLCIRDPQVAPDGFLAKWRRTHPPIEERIATLLHLANVSPREFADQADAALERFERREHQSAAPAAVSPIVAVRAAAGAAGVSPGAAGAGFGAIPSVALSGAAGAANCPRCGATLRRLDYEGKLIDACGNCGGCLVTGDALGAILARREVGFTAAQRRLAEEIAANGDDRRREARAARGAPNGDLISCPRCGRTMLRRHFSYEHALDVDRCLVCDVVWFGRDGLEALQILTERQVD
jgi:Zn-dependent protease with chaperone function/Zn-finger nucleic acid-binding protein